MWLVVVFFVLKVGRLCFFKSYTARKKILFNLIHHTYFYTHIAFVNKGKRSERSPWFVSWAFCFFSLYGSRASMLCVE
jgi:hypothetical protein